MKKIYKFNMVEIALAIVIIAIGISSILVLFPIGINATRAAVEESLQPEISEYVVHYVRSRFLTTWISNPAATDFGSVFSTAYDSLSTTPEDAMKINGDAGSNFTDIKKAETQGLYKFTRTYANGEVFSALIKVWKTATPSTNDAPLYIPDIYELDSPPPQKKADKIHYDDGTGRAPSERPLLSDLFNQFYQSVLVEISWPLESEENERNKRTFRVDVYNPYYKIQMAP